LSAVDVESVVPVDGLVVPVESWPDAVVSVLADVVSLLVGSVVPVTGLVVPVESMPDVTVSVPATGLSVVPVTGST